MSSSLIRSTTSRTGESGCRFCLRSSLRCRLLITLLIGEGRIKRWVGLAVGWCSVGIGIWGLVFHLNSQFFTDFTIKSLVYTAPFVAPLAFCGLGLLLLMNCMVHQESLEWGTMGGVHGIGGICRKLPACTL